MRCEASPPEPLGLYKKLKYFFNESVASHPLVVLKTIIVLCGVQPVSEIDKSGENGFLTFYNRDFYCIQIHDHEVACDGLLFNKIHNMPLVTVAKEDAAFIDYLLRQMKDEFELNDISLEEMMRTYLKQLLIKATRLWKKQHLEKITVQQNNDLEFFRKFTLLVDAYYKEKHTVADYADVLSIASKQ